LTDTDKTIADFQQAKADALSGIAQQFIDPLIEARAALDARIKPLQDERNTISRQINKMQKEAGITPLSTKLDLTPVIKAVLEAKEGVVLKPGAIMKHAIELKLVDANTDNLPQKFAKTLTDLRNAETDWLSSDRDGRNYEYYLTETE